MKTISNTFFKIIKRGEQGLRNESYILKADVFHLSMYRRNTEQVMVSSFYTSRALGKLGLIHVLSVPFKPVLSTGAYQGRHFPAILDFRKDVFL